VDELFSQNELAKHFGVSVRTLERQRVDGTGVPYILIGRLVRYRKSDIEAYTNGRRRGSTSEAA